MMSILRSSCVTSRVELYNISPNGLKKTSGGRFHRYCGGLFFYSAFEMLEPMNEILSKKKFVLASASTRRKEILTSVGLIFDIIPSTFNEESLTPAYYKSTAEYVLDIAKNKMEDVRKKCIVTPDFIIGADTIVVFNGDIYGKPKNREEAILFLKKLNGNCHTVYTAVAIGTKSGQSFSFVDTTLVHMSSLDDETISAYVATGEPLDKAGAYGIQGKGGSIIQKIEGDCYNVMGFPLNKFCKILCSLCKK